MEAKWGDRNVALPLSLKTEKESSAGFARLNFPALKCFTYVQHIEKLEYLFFIVTVVGSYTGLAVRTMRQRWGGEAEAASCPSELEPRLSHGRI